ncbi:MAG: hypothetical protein H0W58_03645 [Acidobacteria bacterium]|nr:hypothetical protein [Acidobacteriota bacterium]
MKAKRLALVARSSVKCTINFMNPFDFFESVSASIEQYPLLTLLIAAIGGVLSTST